jgi:hypothetical protein
MSRGWFSEKGREGQALVFKVADRERGGRVGLGDTFSCGGVVRERMSVTCAQKTRRKSDRLRTTERVCERTRGTKGERVHTSWRRRQARQCQAHLGRHVCLEVVRLPARPGRRYVRRDEGVDLAFCSFYLTILAFLRKVRRSRAEQLPAETHGTHQS